jgi:flagellum-specific peptidoglycan hydrolase FlgJ
MTKQDFLDAAIAAARESSGVSGLPPGVTVAQAALESAWGNSQLSREANNYFGIKAHGDHRSVEMATTEVTNGVAAKAAARFARYESMTECFEDRDQLILRLACYAEARKNASDPEAFIRGLAKHWATDPNYVEKMLGVYRANMLGDLDQSITRQ